MENFREKMLSVLTDGSQVTRPHPPFNLNLIKSIVLDTTALLASFGKN